MYLCIDHANGYIEKKNGNKYLFFDSVDENIELLKKYNDVWNGIKNEIKEVSSGECDYEKDYIKIKFNSDDILPLNKPSKFHNRTITIRSILEQDGKLYPQVFFRWYFVWIKRIKMLEYDRIDISERIDVSKTNLSKEWDIYRYWYFRDIGFKYEPYLCNGSHDLMQKNYEF